MGFYYYKLAMYRKKKGLTQAEAADKLGISRNALVLYENGKCDIPITIFVKMSELYEFDTLDILGVNEPEKSSGVCSDVSFYYMLKAHVCYVIRKEIRANNILHGKGVYDTEYYLERYRHILNEILSDEKYSDNADILADAAADIGNNPEFDLNI